MRRRAGRGTFPRLPSLGAPRGRARGAAGIALCRATRFNGGMPALTREGPMQ